MRRAFTLIELLMVIAIMIVLGSLLIPAVGYARKLVMIGKSVAIIADVEGAIRQFHSTNAMYPMDGAADGSDPAANNAVLVQALAGVNADLYGTNGSHVTGGQILDAWDTPLRYQHFLHYPEEESHPRYGIREDSYQLWSCGPDTVDNDGQGDDESNWKQR